MDTKKKDWGCDMCGGQDHLWAKCNNRLPCTDCHHIHPVFWHATNKASICMICLTLNRDTNAFGGKLRTDHQAEHCALNHLALRYVARSGAHLLSPFSQYL